MQTSLNEAWAQLNRGQFANAASICDQILKVQPDNAAALGCRAMSNWSQRKNVPAALLDMQRAISLAPNAAGHRHNHATILASVGKLDEAQAEFRKSLDLNPDNTQAFYSLAQNSRFTDEDEMVRRVRSRLDQGEITGPAREFASFGLAKIYDDLGRAGEAFRFASDANRIGARPYNLAADQARLADLYSLAESGLFHTTPGSGLHNKAPVFVVGMPRSGTTLVESVLARHPDAYAAGELPFMPQVEQQVIAALSKKGAVNHGPDFALLDVPHEQYREWAENVLSSVWKLAGQKFPVFTDKLPTNAVRLGLISKLFPDARIIHVKRNPLDTGLSNFFTRFHAGHGYASYLDKIGARFRIIADSIAAWKRTADIDILDVRYERMVGDAEPEVRRLLEFIGLEFDDKCLRPHRGERGVMTASQWQVRQPIYQHSVAKWQRYEEWLDPMIAALGGHRWIDVYNQD